ncbi:MAG: hypothetical protein R2795_09770 [Saprospiraceae bacterium]
MAQGGGQSSYLTHTPHENTAATPGSLVNGVAGSDKRYGDAEWLGLKGRISR